MDLFQEFQSVHPGHFVIGDDQIELALNELFQRGFAAGGGGHAELFAQLPQAVF